MDQPLPLDSSVDIQLPKEALDKASTASTAASEEGGVKERVKRGHTQRQDSASPEPEPQSSASAPISKRETGETSCILKLKGLPYTTTEAEIREFFQGYNVKTVRFVFEPDGRPSGLAFAAFDSREEAVKALRKSGDFVGERYVRLLHVPVTEMEAQVRLGTLAIPGNAAKIVNRMAAQQRKRMSFVHPHMQLLPTVVPSAMYPPQPMYQVGMHDIWHSFQARQAVQPGQFAQMQVASQMMPQRSGMPARMMMPGMAMQHGNVQNDARVQQSMPAQMMPHAPLVHTSTVKVRGLPYKASPAEILHFFQGYQYLPDSLQIGLDSLSRPSGEAWLSFVSPTEAARAVQNLNRRYLGNRYLELNLCQVMPQ